MSQAGSSLDENQTHEPDSFPAVQIDLTEMFLEIINFYGVA